MYVYIYIYEIILSTQLNLGVFSIIHYTDPYKKKQFRISLPNGFMSSQNFRWVAVSWVPQDAIMKDKTELEEAIKWGVCFLCEWSALATVDGSEIPNNHRLDVSQTPVNDGINYRSLNWCRIISINSSLSFCCVIFPYRLWVKYIFGYSFPKKIPWYFRNFCGGKISMEKWWKSWWKSDHRQIFRCSSKKEQLDLLSFSMVLLNVTY